MRDWVEYNINKTKPTNNRFKYTDQLLINNFKKKYTQYKYFILLNYAFAAYKYFIKSLSKNKKTLFVGSGWAYTELYLSKKIKLIASDYNNKYVQYHKRNRSAKFKYIKFNLLNKSLFQRKKLYDQIIINNVEYLFNYKQLNTLLNNIKKIGNKKTNYYFIFRSRDSLLIKTIDNYLIPFELKIRKIINFSKEKSYNLVGDLKGFRRTEKEFITILKNNNFKIQAIHRDLFETEYNRLAIVRKLRLSKILSLLFLRSHPYLNIIKFKII